MSKRKNLSSNKPVQPAGVTRHTRREAWTGLETLEARSMVSASPLGPEQQVNPASTLKQNFPAVAAASNGDFIVAYRNQTETDNLGAEIFVRLYNADGTPKGDAFQINPTHLADAGAPALAADAAGDFVITWTDSSAANSDIYARVYNADGSARTDEFIVNNVTTGAQFAPSVGMDSDGDFVVGWLQSDLVAARRFDSTGTPKADQSKVSDSTAGANETITYRSASVAVDSDGDFVVGWSENKIVSVLQKVTFKFSYPIYDDDGNPTGKTKTVPVTYDAYIDKLASNNINIKRYNAAGAQQGNLIAAYASTKVGASIDSVDVAMDGAGDFVVGYSLGLYTSKADPSYPTYIYNTDTGGEVWSRRFTPTGTGAAAQKAYSVVAPLSINGVSADINESGAVTVAWATKVDPDSGVDTDPVVMAQRYDIVSKPIGVPFAINSVVDQGLANPAVCLLDNGNIVFGFESGGVGDADIYFRRFEPPKPNLTGAITSVKVGTASAFDTTLIPGDKVAVATRVTNGPNSALAVSGVTNIAFYASSDGEFGDDILIGTLTNQKLALAIGASTTVTFTWTVGATTPPGTYRIFAKLDAANTTLETSENDNLLDAGTAVNVGWKFGNIGGRNAKLLLNDADGTLVTYALTGNGSGSVDSSYNITLTGTDANTAVVLTAAKSKTVGDNGFANITGITAAGSLKSFTGTTTNLQGNALYIGGSVATLVLRDLASTDGQGSLTVGADGTLASVFTFNNVSNFSLNTNSPIKTLTVNSWSDPDPLANPDTISADNIDALTSKTALAASLSLRGTSLPKVGANTLNKATIGTTASGNWNITGAVGTVAVKTEATFNLRATGNIASVTVGRLANGYVLAGVDPELQSLPVTLDSFVANATLGNFAVTGYTGQTIAFTNSLVAAKTIAKVTLKQVDTATGPGPGAVGFAADLLKSYKRDKVSLANVTNAGDYDATGTFRVQIV